MAGRFQERYNGDERVRAEIAVKNRGYACHSPFSQQPGRHTVEEVLKGEIVSDPLRFLECCAMSVGSGAAVLCSEELAHRLTDRPVRLFIAGGSHTLRTGDRRPMRIPLLPHETEEGYRELYAEMERQDGRWPGFESFGATRQVPEQPVRRPAGHDARRGGDRDLPVRRGLLAAPGALRPDARRPENVGPVRQDQARRLDEPAGA